MVLRCVLFAEIEHPVVIMEQSVVKAAKASSKGLSGNNSAINVAEIKIAKSRNIIEIGVNTADCKNVWPWE